MRLIGVRWLRLVRLVQRRRQRNPPRKPRSVWVKPWLIRRPDLGSYDKLFHELRAEDPEGFRAFIRIDPTLFDEIAARIGPRITKVNTNWRKALTPELKLCATLNYLATGQAYRSGSKFLFRVAHNTISLFIVDVCKAIQAEYSGEVMPFPRTKEAWEAIATEFQRRWQFPHTIGALDGKHIAIRCPPKSGSYYYNYKGYYSIILMALADADYKFIWVEIGANGAASDSQIFNDCDLQEVILDGTIQMPDDKPLAGDAETDTLPYYIVGDNAFALQTWLMKPYAIRNQTDEQWIFNYRLSRARRVVENTFGIMTQRFQCLLTTMKQLPHNVRSIIQACTVLHNLIRIRYPQMPAGFVDYEDEAHNMIPGSWRSEGLTQDMDQVLTGNVGSRRAKKQRILLTHYVNSDAGSVPWQWEMLRRHKRGTH